MGGRLELGDLQGWIEAFSYPAVLALLIAAGLGAPLSEDAVLIAGGLVAAHADGNLLVMIAVAWAGVLIGDSCLWRIGRSLGSRAVSFRFVRRVLTPPRLEWARRHFDKHGAWTVFAARFLIGFRAVTFLSAGTTGMSYRRFIVADAAAATLFVPLLVFLGYRFGEAIVDDVKGTLGWLAIVAVIAVVLAAVVSAVRRRQAGRVGPNEGERVT